MIEESCCPRALLYQIPDTVYPSTLVPGPHGASRRSQAVFWWRRSNSPCCKCICGDWDVYDGVVRERPEVPKCRGAKSQPASWDPAWVPSQILEPSLGSIPNTGAQPAFQPKCWKPAWGPSQILDPPGFHPKYWNPARVPSCQILEPSLGSNTNTGTQPWFHPRYWNPAWVPIPNTGTQPGIHPKYWNAAWVPSQILEPSLGPTPNTGTRPGSQPTSWNHSKCWNPAWVPFQILGPSLFHPRYWTYDVPLPLARLYPKNP
jgi:hypothetical protein